MKLNFGLLIAVQAGRDFKKNGKPKHNQKENRVLRQSDSFASTNVKQNLKFGWMLENNCGPRPSGPRYPEPPAAAEGLPHDVIECDVIRDAQYVAGYQCEAPCQMDPSQTVILYCNCHTQIGPLQFIKDCTWEFEDNKTCPAVPPNSRKFDWECNPKWNVCPEGQYAHDNFSSDYYPTNYDDEENYTTTSTTTTSTTRKTTTKSTTTEKPSNAAFIRRKKIEQDALFDYPDKVIIAEAAEKLTQKTGKELSQISQKINTDNNINTQFFMDSELMEELPEEYTGVRTIYENTGNTGQTPSITNIIDFRPLFTKLLESEEVSTSENSSESFEKLREIRRTNRLTRRMSQQRNQRVTDVDHLLMQPPMMQTVQELGIPISFSRNNRQSDFDSMDNRGQEVYPAKIQSLRIQQKLARMISLRNSLKRDNVILEKKIDAVMDYIKHNMGAKEEGLLYKELYDLETALQVEIDATVHYSKSN